MKITKQFIDKWEPCKEAVDWFYDQDERDSVAVAKKLIKEGHPKWANWLVARLLDRKGRIRYAVYAAKQVLANFEKEYPDDKRPREAINAALRVLKNDTKENRQAAESAAKYAESAARSAAESAAWYAASAAWSAAESAAWYAASAAESAARSAAESAAWYAMSAESAAWYAMSAESAAWYAAESAAWYAARYATQKKILRYGIGLLSRGGMK